MEETLQELVYLEVVEHIIENHWNTQMQLQDIMLVGVQDMMVKEHWRVLDNNNSNHRDHN